MTSATRVLRVRRPARCIIVLAATLALVSSALPGASAAPAGVAAADAAPQVADVLPDAALTPAASAEASRVLVTFAGDTTDAQRVAALDAVDLLDERTQTAAAGQAPGAGITALSLDGPTAPVAVAVALATPAQQRALSRDRRVTSVVADLPIRAHAEVGADAVVVDDPAWPEQDGVRRIRVDEVWEETTGDDDIVVAVIDTGVDAANRDLSGRVLPGYDFVNRDDDPRDDNGHGTAVATIVAAASDTFGLAGICWRCRIMPVKVLDDDGNGYLSDAALGIAWAVDHGADVLNVSLGADGSMPLLDAALAAAEDAGALVVASAGNAGNTIEQWPAADPRVLSVAALDDLDRRAAYSNHGAWIDVSAPGCNPSGWLDNDIIEFCGTSSAAPLVAGSAALLASARAVAGAELRTALEDTAVPVGPGLGAGRIDAWAALGAVPAFSDIAGNVHAANIRILVAAGVTSGCAPGRYCPGQPVTRGQIATFLDNALDLPDGPQRFSDVPADHPHAKGIGAVGAAGITRGCTATRYCPSDTLTRGQMASLLQRALDLPDGVPRFDDVAPDHTHARGVWAIAAAGITTGCEPDLFCPAQTVSRGQMASFLVRAFDL